MLLCKTGEKVGVGYNGGKAFRQFKPHK